MDTKYIIYLIYRCSQRLLVAPPQRKTNRSPHLVTGNHLSAVSKPIRGRPYYSKHSRPKQKSAAAAAAIKGKCTAAKHTSEGSPGYDPQLASQQRVAEIRRLCSTPLYNETRWLLCIMGKYVYCVVIWIGFELWLIITCPGCVLMNISRMEPISLRGKFRLKLYFDVQHFV